MKLGYARVSRTDQNLELQTDAMRAAGVTRVFTDKISGASEHREGLDTLLDVAREGDTIVVWRLDRLARSLKHLIELARTFDDRGIQLISLTDNIDTTTPAGKLVFHMFGALAEFERNLIIERTRAGLAAAKARGKLGGRKPALSPEKQKAVKTLLAAAKAADESPNYRAIGRSVGVSERTIRRFVSDRSYGKKNADALA